MSIDSPRTASARTKKQQILRLWDAGLRDPLKIATETGASSSYVAQVLAQAGLLEGYFDLYTTTARDQNAYSRFFRGVLSFRDEQAARTSVERIDALYREFEAQGDRAGQHQAMVIALTGYNRARWSGKQRAADVFHSWLCAH